jgi:hypothetical protein
MSITPATGPVAYATAQACLEALFNQAVAARRQGRKPERCRYYFNVASGDYHIGHARRRWPRRNRHATDPS